jgi:hypothetical protein
MCTTFVSCTNIHGAKFLFLHHYMLRTIFVMQTNIPCTFHSTCCIMPNFSTPPQCTNTLHAPLTKLLREKIYPHCVRTNQTPLRSANTAHITCALIICVHTVHTLLCACTQRNSKFIMHTLTPTFFCVAQKFSAHSRTPRFFYAMPNFSACTSTPTFFHVVPKFSAHTSTPTFFCTVPKFSACTSTPTFFCAVPKFSALTSTLTFFWVVPKI